MRASPSRHSTPKPLTRRSAPAVPRPATLPPPRAPTARTAAPADSGRASVESAFAVAQRASSLDELRGTIVGLLNAPATKVVRVINEPASKLARVFGAYAAKEAA